MLFWFSIIMKGSVSKEKQKRCWRANQSKEANSDSKWDITLDKANRWEKYVVSIFDTKVSFIKMHKLHKWIAGRDVAWAKHIEVGAF
jgi:hypothetical protein